MSMCSIHTLELKKKTIASSNWLVTTHHGCRFVHVRRACPGCCWRTTVRLKSSWAEKTHLCGLGPRITGAGDVCRKNRGVFFDFKILGYNTLGFFGYSLCRVSWWNRCRVDGKECVSQKKVGWCFSMGEHWGMHRADGSNLRKRESSIALWVSPARTWSSNLQAELSPLTTKKSLFTTI